MDGRNRNQEEPVRCMYCKSPTEMTETKMCDSCRELDARIQSDLVLAERILNIHKNRRCMDILMD